MILGGRDVSRPYRGWVVVAVPAVVDGRVSSGARKRASGGRIRATTYTPRSNRSV